MRSPLTSPAIGVVLQPSERYDVTASLIGATTLAVATLGWLGYKALLRIETWGRNMNQIDGIFQDAAQPDQGLDYHANRGRGLGRVALAPALKTPRHHV